MGVTPCDLDWDGDVTFEDFVEFADKFSVSDARPDLNGDGRVDWLDTMDFVDTFELVRH